MVLLMLGDLRGLSIMVLLFGELREPWLIEQWLRKRELLDKPDDDTRSVGEPSARVIYEEE